ncbi:MAG: fibronectin type III domain-containing protein [Treponema sp.]|jgi:fibronectin type 3 domain-containing protein|nr:fibronectin type III domain-containing protein [Treponema sp.]
MKHILSLSGISGVLLVFGVFLFTGCDSGVHKSPPSAPSGVTATALESGGIRVSWNSVSDATGYRVIRSGSENGTYVQVGWAESASYTDKEVSGGTTYYYHVMAVNEGGDSPLSSIVSATAVMIAPANVTAVAQSTSGILVSWDSVSGAASYKVYRGGSADGEYTLAGSPTEPAYTDTELSMGTTYYYKVSAVTSGGEGPLSSAVSTATSVPGAPVNVTAATQWTSGIQVSWDSVSDATGYKVYRSGSADGEYTLAGSPTATSYLDTELSMGTTYYYKVSAVTSGGEGPLSSSASATTRSLPAPANVTAAAPPSNSISSILVSWDSVSGAASYKVYRGGSADGEYTLAGSLEATSYTATESYTDTELSMGTTYYYKVSAVDSGGEGPLSAPVSATTRVAGATNVTAAALSSNSISISWDSVSGATGYKVYRYTSLSYNAQYTLAGSPTTASYIDTGLSASTTYYYKVSVMAGERESSQSPNYISATTISVESDTRLEGVYIGIISFAGTANDLGLVRLNATGRNTLLNQLNANYTIAAQSGTALFYSVHQALSSLKSKEDQYPANLELVNVITFTDGLDNGSTGMSAANPIEEQTFDSDSEYTTYLSGQIASRAIAGKPITAYSVGVRGEDVSNTTKFESDLEKIASANKSQTLDNFNALQTTFQSIADSLQITRVTSTAFTMKTTLLGSGAKVRMTFDVTGANPADAASSAKYIEGIITRTGTGSSMTYTFNTITYAGGLGSELGAGPITGVINGSEVNFTFTGVEGYTPAVDESKAQQWIMTPDTTAWQRNSEYSVTGATTTETESLSTIIYLVLDSSTSLTTEQIGQIRSAAAAFINSLYSQLTGFIPSGVSATAAGSTGVAVSWNRVSSADSYRIYRSASVDGSYSQIDSVNDSSSTSYTDTGLSPDTTYYYKVSAYNNGGGSSNNALEGAQSSYASVTTGISPPSNVMATAVDSSGITVSWDSVSGASGYTVYRSAQYNGTYEEIASISDSSVTSYTNTELPPYTLYYYKVSASNGNGEGSLSSFYGAITGVVAPSNVSATATSSTSITVSWDAPSGASLYMVYRSPSSPAWNLGKATPDTFLTDNDASPGVTYCYKVSARYEDYGDSVESVVSATTPSQ